MAETCSNCGNLIYFDTGFLFGSGTMWIGDKAYHGCNFCCERCMDEYIEYYEKKDALSAENKRSSTSQESLAVNEITGYCDNCKRPIYNNREVVRYFNSPFGYEETTLGYKFCTKSCCNSFFDAHPEIIKNYE